MAVNSEAPPLAADESRSEIPPHPAEPVPLLGDAIAAAVVRLATVGFEPKGTKVMAPHGMFGY